ncbi:MAG TPA: 50S ribosomal protein L21 [Candidatus Paceibacterota bacterium]|jgi:large subunit ribosomal protein L21|nr:50S ribosomal protein L21 [Candidatus Paceibacterota bacterium]HOH11470.1 50S ribosomal protein L21 [Candidatus Paceibacterota bacterium]HOY11099.1 50S ribosomal protein L21 [Candidatus Paceibacterota bacterium]HPB60445.1 50S ribosomal protein L21 [Candidatus Paceibacterota bacterium]HPN89744.1 50S ribosomal protein L21 [Candidatus Paceibacterota bacterium]
MFAIVETGGKQYKITEGDVLKVEKLPKPENGKIIFDKVLLINDGQKTQIGAPYLEGATVTVDFMEEGRGKKITVIHYKAKVRYRKVYGHRQPFTKVKVGKVA